MLRISSASSPAGEKRACWGYPRTSAIICGERFLCGYAALHPMWFLSTERLAGLCGDVRPLGLL
jgi:hypothetical protein